jgi:uncharacterized lipoprotein YmbA
MISIFKICAAGGLCVALLGCASPDNKYYTLNPTAPVVAAGQMGSSRTFAIQDVSIPEALDRPQIVVGLDENRVDVREYDRWVEPFDGLVRRTLAQNLMARLGPDRLLEKPDKESALLSIAIDAFGREADRVVLRGRWALKDQRKDAAAAPPHSFDKSLPLGQNDPLPITVADLSRWLGDLSDEIARSLGGH